MSQFGAPSDRQCPLPGLRCCKEDVRRPRPMLRADNNGYELHVLATFVCSSVEDAQAKCKREIKMHVEKGVKVDACNPVGESCMHSAARYGTPEMLQAFVEEDMPCKGATAEGWTPLMYVARSATARVGAAGALAMARALIDGPPFKEKDGDAVDKGTGKLSVVRIRSMVLSCAPQLSFAHNGAGTDDGPHAESREAQACVWGCRVRRNDGRDDGTAPRSCVGHSPNGAATPGRRRQGQLCQRERMDSTALRGPFWRRARCVHCVRPKHPVAADGCGVPWSADSKLCLFCRLRGSSKCGQAC